jgi:hypothetical protein
VFSWAKGSAKDLGVKRWRRVAFVQVYSLADNK